MSMSISSSDMVLSMEPACPVQPLRVHRTIAGRERLSSRNRPYSPRREYDSDRKLLVVVAEEHCKQRKFRCSSFELHHHAAIIQCDFRCRRTCFLQSSAACWYTHALSLTLSLSLSLSFSLSNPSLSISLFLSLSLSECISHTPTKRPLACFFTSSFRNIFFFAYSAFLSVCKSTDTVACFHSHMHRMCVCILNNNNTLCVIFVRSRERHMYHANGG